MSEPYLDQGIVRSLLRYNRRTGKFHWRKRPGKGAWNARYAGKEAGARWSPDGERFYIVLRIFDYPFLAHRIAFLMVRARWPEPMIDHRDRDGTNNRWRNLREATDSQNGHNRGANRNNKLGIKGICQTKNGRFRATRQYRGKRLDLGIFPTIAAARDAYSVDIRRRGDAFASMS